MNNPVLCVRHSAIDAIDIRLRPHNKYDVMVLVGGTWVTQSGEYPSHKDAIEEAKRIMRLANLEDDWLGLKSTAKEETHV
jgi:hypothetical protein